MGSDVCTSTPLIGMIDRLTALEQSRKAERERRREEREDLSDPRESIAGFLANFEEKRKGIDQRLGSVQNGDVSACSASGAAPLLDEIEHEIQALDTSLSEASYFLPTYEQRALMLSLQKLRDRISELKVSMVPKKKFTFSRKTKKQPLDHDRQAPNSHIDCPDKEEKDLPSSALEVRECETEVPSGIKGDDYKASSYDLELIKRGQGLMGKSGQTFVFGSDLVGKDFVMMDLDDCVVHLRATLPALRMYRLKNCRVCTGPVVGATYVDDVSSCSLMVGTYQMRIHRARATTFHLRVRSRPIIEHSSGLAFGPYQPVDQGMVKAFDLANLGRENGMWKEVDDFGWIKSSQSPNWRVLREEEWGREEGVPERGVEVTDGDVHYLVC